MIRLVCLSVMACGARQAPTSPKTPPPAVAAQRQDINPTVLRAKEVLDSLLLARKPRLSGADNQTWNQQAAWFTSLRDRIKNLLALVEAPAKVTTAIPADPRNIEALQKEAEQESLKFTALSNILKARHEMAMNAIRNMK